MTGAIVDTRSGKVQGLERNGIHVFRGIPYAAPPVGGRRWKPPQREDAWDDVRDATKFSAQSAQGLFMLDQMLGGEERAKSEDSLYLNVFTPGLDDARRPVMVWIHGGAFMFGEGATPWYDGTKFATRGDVVLVSLNYRLGSFGFLHLADLFGDDVAGSGNVGLLDQVAALEWVRDNIEAFGGDPNRVTIFGESAGAGSIGTLLGMPAARGLFSAAIPQSGAASWFATREHATEIASVIVEQLGVKPGDLDALYAKSTDEIITAQAAVGLETDANGLPFQPVVDGTVLPRPALAAIRDGSAAGVRLLIGTNKNEFTLFSVLDPSLASLDEAGIRARVRTYYGEDGVDEFLATYRRILPGSTLQDQWNAMATDALFRVPAIQLAEAQLPHAPVWSYFFTWESPAFGGLLKSTHALEIPFVFDTLDQPGSDLFTGDGPERAAIASRMHDAWIAFARDGAPGHAAIPEWPQYDTTRRATMRIDETWEALDDPGAETRRLWDNH
ncbi:MAG TPA: carboxylesterase/lipase family protein [Acidimicrobiia bacterium]|jgi:para-nitrobenzyl esterase|nr:carboxylesterase/lipase family protein [Acidimicrobiia bacterium]